MELNRESRITVNRAAEIAGMHPAHFRRLVRQGIFPQAKKTAKGRPFYDQELIARVKEILNCGIGDNGEEVMFYRRTKTQSRKPRRGRTADAYLRSLAQGVQQLGVTTEEATQETLTQALEQEFGKDRPDLAQAIPRIARRLLS